MSTILVVDDEAEFRNLAEKIIKPMGHVVILSPDGKHAYELLKINNDIDLLITDILMPHMDGRELIRKVRENNAQTKIPIIAVSGYIGPKEISEVLKLGADVFMGKPFGLSEFRSTISKCLEC